MKKIYSLIPSACIFVMCCVIFLSVIHPTEVGAQAQSFSFGAAGDFAAGSNFSNTVSSMARSGLSFAIPLGDFSYSSNSSSWISTVKSAFPAGFPFEIIAGNHDNNLGISPYQSGLPNQISSISTDPLTVYGEQYYFDYPTTSPLMRVILLGQNEGSPSYTYPAGSANYNWVAAAIDDAHAKNIPWVATAMHKNCITSGTKGCEIGTALLNLMISKHVDLILQGHDHTYQRSKPLRNAASDPTNAAGCATVSTSFNAACVAATAGNSYSNSLGSTLVINGAGGQGLYSHSNTSQDGFFASSNFSSYGFSKFTVTATQITSQFVNNSAGGYSDSFTITKGAVNPTATPTPGTNPTATPVPGCPLKSTGDANCDGKKDLIDFEIWRQEFTNVRTTKTADFDGTGTVTIVDFEIWRRGAYGI